MNFIKAVKNLTAQNIRIPIGAVIFGILLIILLDSSIIIKIFCRSLPNLSSNFIENFFVAGGLLWLLFDSFGMFLIWEKACNRRRLAEGKSAMRQAAQKMKCHYDEYQKSGLSPHLDNYKRCCILRHRPKFILR